MVGKGILEHLHWYHCGVGRCTARRYGIYGYVLRQLNVVQAYEKMQSEHSRKKIVVEVGLDRHSIMGRATINSFLHS